MKTIEEKNRVIAEFMGWEKVTEGQVGFITPFSLRLIKQSEFKFHTSWNWLMLVVEKIELLGYSVEKNFQRVDKDWQCLITRGNDILFQEFEYNSIEAMYQAVFQFIEWFNNQK
jgi:hypothetical protein